MEKIEKIYWKFKQFKRQYSLLCPPLKELENRKYLTISGIKNYNELTLKDKYQLQIKIN